METIKIYLETMFSALPKTEEVSKLKNELFVSMEEKYNELKAAEKSENEVVGTVISEFGNIDELVEEMGLPRGQAESDGVYLTRDEAMGYLAQMKKSGFWIGIGVWLIMTGVALMLLISGFAAEIEPATNLGDAVSLIGDVVSDTVNSLTGRGGEPEDGDFRGALGIFVLLMFIAGAVPLFIVHGMKLEPYAVLEEKPVCLDTSTRAEIELLDREHNSRFVWSIAGGVALILFAVAAFILFGVMATDEFRGFLLSLMLFVIGLAAYMFITSGMLKGAFECLLGRGEYSDIIRISRSKSRKMERIIGVAAAFFWPLVVAAYLAWSFLSEDWHITWVIWPICGLIFGAFAGAVGAYYSLGGDEKK